MRPLRLFYLVVFLLLLVPVSAFASDVPPVGHDLPLPSVQFWAGVLGSVAPLLAYVLNHHAPWLSEQFKTVVQYAVAAATGAVYDLIASGDFKFDTAHLEVVGAAVFAAFLAHNLIYAPGGWNTKLGGGTNAQDNLAR